MTELYRHYRWDFLAMGVTFMVVVYFLGLPVLPSLLVLTVLEISFSFDNAIVNAKVLSRMSKWWQDAFIWVGIPIAVFGMRLVFPIAIVAATAGLHVFDVVDLALHDTDAYAAELHEAHPQIVTFAGIYLLLIFLDFVLDTREHVWLGKLEHLLAKGGNIKALSILLALGTTAVFAATSGDHSTVVLWSGVISILTYMVVTALTDLFDQEDDDADGPVASKPIGGAVGKQAMMLFLYLEMQDAAFSFDGVSGAFAVSNLVLVIAAGLGIGALFVRSMTIHFVRTGQLTKYIYLEHGAHWAIGALATCMLLTLHYPIPELFTGLIGVGFILPAWYSSYKYNLAHPEEAHYDMSELDNDDAAMLAPVGTAGTWQGVALDPSLEPYRPPLPVGDAAPQFKKTIDPYGT